MTDALKRKGGAIVKDLRIPGPSEQQSGERRADSQSTSAALKRARELAAITCRGCKNKVKYVPFADGSGGVHEPYEFTSTVSYLCTSKADELLPLLDAWAQEARLEEAKAMHEAGGVDCGPVCWKCQHIAALEQRTGEKSGNAQKPVQDR